MGPQPDAGPAAHVLTIHTAGSGLVRAADRSFECAAAQCTESLTDGRTVQLVAVAGSSATFAGWQGACSGAGDCSLTLNADRDVTATFTAAPPPPPPPPPPPGMVNVSVSLAGRGVGRVTSSPAGLDCPGACSMPVQSGTTVSLTAAAGADSAFAGWAGACNGAGACSLMANSDQSVTATFDAVPPPPPPPNSCADLGGPSDAVLGSYVIPSATSCDGAAGDASGTLAFLRVVSTDTHFAEVHFVSTTGAALRQSSVGYPPGLLSQPEGLAGIQGGVGFNFGPPNAVLLPRWDHAGNSVGTPGQVYLTHYAGAADPNGGVLLAGDFAQSYNGPTSHQVNMYTGAPQAFGVKWGPKALASSGTVFGAGVDLLGRSLVITDGSARFGGGAISAQWFDRDGTPLTGEFVLVTGFTPGANTWFEASALVGSGLLVRRIDADSGGRLHSLALVLVSSGTATVSAAPAWMVSRRDVQFQLARGRRAYATAPYGALGVTCSQRVEVLAPDGTSCGTRDYSMSGATCDTRDLTLGLDGSVIQQLPVSMETTTDTHGSHTCTYRWWTGAVR